MQGKKTNFDAVFVSFLLVYVNINQNIEGKITMIQLQITYILSHLTYLCEITLPKKLLFSKRGI